MQTLKLNRKPSVITLLLFFALSAPFILSSCRYDDTVSPTDPTSLKVFVSDEYSQNSQSMGGPVSGATVILYETEEDRLMEKNAIDSGLTNADGSVVFSTALKPIVYHFDVLKGAQTNWDHVNSTVNPLVDHAANHANTNIHGIWNHHSPTSILANVRGKQWKVTMIKNYKTGEEVTGVPIYSHFRSDIFRLYKNGNLIQNLNESGTWEMMNSGLKLFVDGNNDPILDIFNIQDMNLDKINGIGVSGSNSDTLNFYLETQ